MKLTVIERILLGNLLPKEGNFTNLKLLRVLREELTFSDEENKLLSFQMLPDGRSRWNEFQMVNKDTGKPVEGDPRIAQAQIDANPDLFESRPIVDEKEIEVGETVGILIVKLLKKLDKDEKLEDSQFTLYEKFVIEE